MASSEKFKPALIVVDFQEDFCPPHGSLAVPDGRSIATPINKLLTLPFTRIIATRDWHPASHVSFASNHTEREPYTSSVTIRHPHHPLRTYTTTLWPVHCVQNTAGARLVPELDASRLHRVVDKGTQPGLEMYSAFYDPFRICDTGLAHDLTDAGVTHVFVVGLAGDYCVKATAEHSAAEGFTTFVVEEATRSVNPDKWHECKKEIEAKGVKIVSMDGSEVAKVQALAG